MKKSQFRYKYASLGCFMQILILLVTKIHISEPKWVVITLAMIGKLAIAGAFQLMYLYICELLPTEVRAQAIGTSNIFSRIGSILAPFITDGLVCKSNDIF